ncbi:MAG: hypothetical protein OES09_05490 [Gammaproteobacteria bacterium]|nr:hypothetical protein [Gammaproteobacteria bacterium]
MHRSRIQAIKTLAIPLLALITGMFPWSSVWSAEQECAAITSLPEAKPIKTNANPVVPVTIQADEIEFPSRKVVHLKGYTQLIRGGHKIFADELIYDKNDQTVEARGLVKFETPNGDIIKTPILNYDVLANRAESGRADFVLATREPKALSAGRDLVTAYGQAERVELEGEHLMRLKNVQITTCINGDEDMTFAATDLEVNLNTGLRVAKRAKVQILVPERHPEINKILN